MTTGAIRQLGGGDAVQPRHLDVEDDQVGPELSGHRHGLLAVGGFPGDGVALLLEHLLQVQADQRLVLGDEDPAGGNVRHGVSWGS